MVELVNAIKEWPTIIQGALGSALFWLFLLLAQKAFHSIVQYMSKRSKGKRISWLVSRECKHSAFGNPSDAAAAFATSALIYRSLQHVYKALMWLGLGIVLSYFYQLTIVVGGIGFIYFLFKAYDEVSPFKPGENTPEARAKVIEELITLGKLPAPQKEETNNKIKQDA